MKTERQPKWTAEKSWPWGEATRAPRSWPPRRTWTCSARWPLHPRTAAELARRLQCDLRGLTILLDALVALRLLGKTGRRYALPPGLERFPDA